MDPLTLGIAALMTVLTVGGGFIFARQESRIKALEERLEKITSDHIDCREENAALKMRVRELEKRLGVESDDVGDTK
jgi:BMFP domain-containing protein YqiC